MLERAAQIRRGGARRRRGGARRRGGGGGGGGGGIARVRRVRCYLPRRRVDLVNLIGGDGDLGTLSNLGTLSDLGILGLNPGLRLGPEGWG